MFSFPFLIGMGLILGPCGFHLNVPYVARIVLAGALSVSALSVIIKILKDQKLIHLKTGRMVIAIASLCDIAT